MFTNFHHPLGHQQHQNWQREIVWISLEQMEIV